MHPADELRAEHDYRECDPLNLDGSAMDDPNAFEVMTALDAFLSDYTKRSTFYLKAASEAPEWKKKIFAGGYEAVEVKIELATKLLQAGHTEAAEFALKDAIDSYDYMEERIKDWATD